MHCTDAVGLISDPPNGFEYSSDRCLSVSKVLHALSGVLSREASKSRFAPSYLLLAMRSFIFLSFSSNSVRSAPSCRLALRSSNSSLCRSFFSTYSLNVSPSNPYRIPLAIKLASMIHSSCAMLASYPGLVAKCCEPSGSLKCQERTTPHGTRTTIYSQQYISLPSTNNNEQ